MSKQVIDISRFRKGIKAYATKGALFMETALEAYESAPATPFKKDGAPTKAFLDHIEAFRELLMQKGEDTPRQDWEDAGQPDSSYRGYVTHMKNAIVGIALNPDDFSEMSFKALAAAGKALLNPPKPKGEGKENPLDDLLPRAEALLKAAPRGKSASKFDREVSQFLADMVAAYAKDDA